jgi:hypothetical protein
MGTGTMPGGDTTRKPHRATRMTTTIGVLYLAWVLLALRVNPK